MNHPVENLPWWVALPVMALLLLGSLLALIGAIGLVRLDAFFKRLHGPALIVTFGIGSVLIASMLYFSALQARPVVHELLITVFVTLTAPVTSMLIGRAALYRVKRKESPPEQQESS